MSWSKKVPAAISRQQKISVWYLSRCNIIVVLFENQVYKVSHKAFNKALHKAVHILPSSANLCPLQEDGNNNHDYFQTSMMWEASTNNNLLLPLPSFSRLLHMPEYFLIHMTAYLKHIFLPNICQDWHLLSYPHRWWMIINTSSSNNTRLVAWLCMHKGLMNGQMKVINKSPWERIHHCK